MSATPPLPLAQKRVVVTRASHQAAELSELLRAAGAEPIAYPCIEIVPPEDTAVLDAALQAAAAGEFDWLLLTSVNTVAVLAQRLAAKALSLDRIRAAAVGPATAAAVQRELRIATEVVPEEHVAEALAGALGAVAGQRLLLPQSEIARPLLARRLGEAGAEVTAVAAYRTIQGKGGAAVPALLADGQIDAITFTSSSTVRYFLARLAQEGGRRSDLNGVCLACLGPVTAATLAEMGLKAAVAPEVYTLPAMVAALALHFR